MAEPNPMAVQHPAPIIEGTADDHFSAEAAASGIHITVKPYAGMAGTDTVNLYLASRLIDDRPAVDPIEFELTGLGPGSHSVYYIIERDAIYSQPSDPAVFYVDA
ncbi:MAG TPA: hypothetical protein VGS62_04545 [Streptosporangiaceae bacterium]|nr:hypothetical protein [Streptosporangiaceae bacterium]